MGTKTRYFRVSAGTSRWNECIVDDEGVPGLPAGGHFRGQTAAGQLRVQGDPHDQRGRGHQRELAVQFGWGRPQPQVDRKRQVLQPWSVVRQGRDYTVLKRHQVVHDYRLARAFTEVEHIYVRQWTWGVFQGCALESYTRIPVGV